MPAFVPHLRCWDGQCVAYDEHSGDTHLLGILAGRVLAALADGIADFDGLARQIARTLDVEPDDEFLTNLKRTLSELQAKGLSTGACCSPN